MEKKSYSYLLNILFAVLLIFFTLSILPILILGFFAVPAADDYSYGFRVYHAICEQACPVFLQQYFKTYPMPMRTGRAHIPAFF